MTTIPIPKALEMTPPLYEYLLAHCVPRDAVLEELAGATRRLLPDQCHMQIPPEEGVLLTLLTRLIEAREVVEVGTFTGYSTICLARGVSDGGRVLTCEICADWVDVAHGYWERAGVADRIDAQVGPGLDSLRALPEREYLDLAFIDADKPGYIGYWEQLIPRMRPGGLVIVDNVFFQGQVVAQEPGEKGAAVRAFNAHAAADRRVELVMLAAADGLTLARKLGSSADASIPRRSA